MMTAWFSGQSQGQEETGPCLFCPKLKSHLQQFNMLNKALYLKHSSSQNFFWEKDINDHIDRLRKPPIILFKDQVLYEEDEEYLTDCFDSQEIKTKHQFLTEYYKYHNEIPRYFVQPSNDILNKYYDKKRRIDYYKIRKILNQQNDEPQVDVTYSQQQQGSQQQYSQILNTYLEQSMKEKVTKLDLQQVTLQVKDITDLQGTQQSVTLRELNGYLQEQFTGNQQDSLSIVDDTPVQMQNDKQTLFQDMFLNRHFQDVHQSCQQTSEVQNIYYNMNVLNNINQNQAGKSTNGSGAKKKTKQGSQEINVEKITHNIKINKKSLLSTSQQLFLHQTKQNKTNMQKTIINKNLLQIKQKINQNSLNIDHKKLKQKLKQNQSNNLNNKTKEQETNLETNNDLLKQSSPNFFFNFNINKINVPIEIMKQINQKWSKTNNSVSKKKITQPKEYSEATIIQPTSNKKAKLISQKESLKTCQQLSSKQYKNLHINIYNNNTTKNKKVAQDKSRLSNKNEKSAQVITTSQKSNPKISLNVNKTNIQIKKSLVDIKNQFNSIGQIQKPISLNHGQLQGLLKKVSDQINQSKFNQSTQKKQNLRSSSQNNFESSLHKMKLNKVNGEEEKFKSHSNNKTAPKMNQYNFDIAKKINQQQLQKSVKNNSQQHIRSISSLVKTQIESRKDFIHLNKQSLKRQNSINLNPQQTSQQQMYMQNIIKQQLKTQKSKNNNQQSKQITDYNPKDLLNKDKIKQKLVNKSQYKSVYDKFLANNLFMNDKQKSLNSQKDPKIFNSQIIKQINKIKII